MSSSIVGIEPGESLPDIWCDRCVVNEVDEKGDLCRPCDLAENGPSDQEQEDMAEAADYARERDNQSLRDAGRGHLVR